MRRCGSDNSNNLQTDAASTDFNLPPELARDLELLMGTELQIGGTPISKLSPKTARPMWVRFRHEGRICNRSYRSAAGWRVKVTMALKNNEPLQVLEMDEWGRVKAMFPKEVMIRLSWNTSQVCDPLPVARFYDPAGASEILLVRSRLNGHAVDALHNLSDRGCIVQPLWVADIMRLHPLLGIKLVRDEAFNPTIPISAYSSEANILAAK